MLKYFKLFVSYPVRSKIRDELIKTEILIQEAKYMDNLKKFQQLITDCKEPKKRICSRLLKLYADDFVNHRDYEKDQEIFKGYIDQSLPMEDPKRAASKLQKQKTLKKGEKS